MVTRTFLDRRNFMRCLLGVAATAVVALPASKVEAAPALVDPDMPSLVDPDMPAPGAIEVQARDQRPSDARPTERRGESPALPPGGAAPARPRAARTTTRPARPARAQARRTTSRTALRMRY